MNQENYLDKLKETLHICEIHSERVNYALNKVKSYFPLTIEKYRELDSDDLSYLDQLIFRFSKLQDSMGNRLFPFLLRALGEDIDGKPFIDVLTKMEKLNLLENHKDWFLLRETRNLLTHEYPFVTQEIIDGLNLLIEQTYLLEKIWNNLQKFARNRFQV